MYIHVAHLLPVSKGSVGSSVINISRAKAVAGARWICHTLCPRPAAAAALTVNDIWVIRASMVAGCIAGHISPGRHRDRCDSEL